MDDAYRPRARRGPEREQTKQNEGMKDKRMRFAVWGKLKEGTKADEAMICAENLF